MLVLAEDWERLVRESSVLDASIKSKDGFSWSQDDVRFLISPHSAEKFLQVLREIGNKSAIFASTLTQLESMALVRAGFLVSSSSLAKGSLSVASLPDLPSSSAAASASRRDGTGQSRDYQDGKLQSPFHTASLFLSLPNTGPYLRLLGAGRKHLLSLLQKSRSSEAPVYLLRDRWDGAIETEKSAAKRMRGEFAGTLPGKTRKWKELYGMSFRWALEEAQGAGLIELFDTGSVGPAVRAL